MENLPNKLKLIEGLNTSIEQTRLLIRKLEADIEMIRQEAGVDLSHEKKRKDINFKLQLIKKAKKVIEETKNIITRAEREMIN